MPKVMTNCEECNRPGGQVPKHYGDGVVAMLHDVCAVRQMEKYRADEEVRIAEDNRAAGFGGS